MSAHPFPGDVKSYCEHLHKYWGIQPIKSEDELYRQLPRTDRRKLQRFEANLA
jgi:hypothetical protein